MTKAAWIQAALRRRSLWLAGGALLLLVLFVVLLLSQQDWRNRAAILERENTGLQLTELAQELTAQSDGLAERARELAESDAVIRLVQETTDPSADRLDLADMSRRSVDSLLVLNASRAVRFSVTITDGQLSEQPPRSGVDAVCRVDRRPRRCESHLSGDDLCRRPVDRGASRHRPLLAGGFGMAGCKPLVDARPDLEVGDHCGRKAQPTAVRRLQDPCRQERPMGSVSPRNCRPWIHQASSRCAMRVARWFGSSGSRVPKMAPLHRSQSQPPRAA